MAKPQYWLVFIEGEETRRFYKRSEMRCFVAARKLKGQKPIVKPIGF